MINPHYSTNDIKKILTRRDNWRKKAEESEQHIEALKKQLFTQSKSFEKERQQLEDKRRDELAKALGYKNIAETIDLAQVDYKLICDTLYEEIEALEKCMGISQCEDFFNVMTEALRRVRSYEKEADKKAMEAQERMQKAYVNEFQAKEDNRKLKLIILILSVACGCFFFVVLKMYFG